MPEPTIALFYGDPYHCEQAVAAREAAVSAGEPVERITRFGDEIDIKAFSIEISSGSLFSARRHFLLRHTEAVKPAKLLYSLLDLPLPPETYITLVAPGGKGVDTLIKRVREKGGKVQGFPRARGRSLERAAAAILEGQGIKLPPGAVTELLGRAGGDLLFLQEEARKLAAYSGRGNLTQEEISILSYSGGEESIYPFLDLFGARDLRGALTALARLHVDPSRLFPALLHQLTRLTEVRILKDGGLKPQEIASELGIPEWLSRRLLAQVKSYTQQELAAALSLGIELDQAIKRGGIRPADAVFLLILDAMNSPRSPAPGCSWRSRPSR